MNKVFQNAYSLWQHGHACYRLQMFHSFMHKLQQSGSLTCWLKYFADESRSRKKSEKRHKKVVILKQQHCLATQDLHWTNTVTDMKNWVQDKKEKAQLKEAKKLLKEREGELISWILLTRNKYNHFISALRATNLVLKPSSVSSFFGTDVSARACKLFTAVMGNVQWSRGVEACIYITIGAVNRFWKFPCQT